MAEFDFDDGTFTVGGLCQAIQVALDVTFPGELWVRGEIHDLKRPASGHVYFDLVDPGELGRAMRAKLSVALFQNNKYSVNGILRRAGGGVRMTDGVEVRLRGTLDFHPPSGQLKVVMTSIDPAYTLGRLAADRDRLLRQLALEGLLERNGSLSIHAAPLRIGLVTSWGSAAQADFVDELSRSGYGFTVLAADVRVQGEGASAALVTALARLQTHGVDVIAVVRGGGARTDLATFDSEDVVRAVANCGVPVWTGIGHEIDSSLTDEVAHSAFKTPTACASALVDRVTAYLRAAEQRWAAISGLAVARITSEQTQLDRIAHQLQREAGNSLRLAADRIDRLAIQLTRESNRTLASAENRLSAKVELLRALDPQRALNRGWSITHDTDGHLVRSVVGTAKGTNLVTRVADGLLHSTVTTTTDAATVSNRD